MTYPESERPPEPEREPVYGTQPAPAAAPESWERPPGGRSRWTGGRIASLVIGSVLALIAAALLIVGAVALVFDRTQRDDDGYISFGTDTYSTNGYAIATDRIDLRGVEWNRADSLIGDIRIRATSVGTDGAIFVGIGPANAVEQYLAGVQHTIIRDVSGDRSEVTQQGGPPAAPPEQAGIWAVEVSGTGTQDLVFPAVDGEWAAVAMNQDASAGVNVRTQVAATLPSLLDFAIWTLVVGAVLLAVALVLIIIPARRASADRRPPERTDEVAYTP